MHSRLLFHLWITISRFVVRSATMIPATSSTTGESNLCTWSPGGVISGLITIAWLSLSNSCMCDLKNINNSLCSFIRARLRCAWLWTNLSYCSRNLHLWYWGARVRSLHDSCPHRPWIIFVNMYVVRLALVVMNPRCSTLGLWFLTFKWIDDHLPHLEAWIEYANGPQKQIWIWIRNDEQAVQ